MLQTTFGAELFHFSTFDWNSFSLVNHRKYFSLIPFLQSLAKVGVDFAELSQEPKLLMMCREAEKNADWGHKFNKLKVVFFIIIIYLILAIRRQRNIDDISRQLNIGSLITVL